MKKLFLAVIFTGALLLAACGAAYDAAPATEPMAPAAPAADNAMMMMRTPQALTEITETARDFDYGGYATAVAPIAANLEAQPARMLIQRATVEIAAEEFDETMTNLRSAAASFGGYTESSGLFRDWTPDAPDVFEVRGVTRIFSITMRVPVGRFEAALHHVEGYGEVLDLRQTTDDVTGQFADFQRRMEVRMIEEDRLLELVEQAEELEHILILEERLTQVRHHIEFYRGAMAGLGDQASFSTINVILWEILEEEEEEEEEEGYTFGERIVNTFNTSVDIVGVVLRGFVIFMAGAIVPLLILGVIAVIILAVVRFFSKRAAARPPKPVSYPPLPQNYDKSEEPKETKEEVGEES
jgi:hypothetical protein